MRELRKTAKVIVTAALTGAMHGKDVNPNLPLTPEEIAQSAYESWNEGAAIAHIHAREPETNKPTTDPDILRDINQRIREKCDIIIQNSTNLDFTPPNMEPARLPSDGRIKAIEMNPEMASLDIMPGYAAIRRGRLVTRICTLSDLEHGAKAMLDRGIKPELELFDPVSLNTVDKLINKGLLTKPYWISFVFGVTMRETFMSYSPRYLIFLIDTLPPDSMFSVLGVGNAEVEATTLSILLGGHLRVGLEDNIYYEKGKLAESNAQLVFKAVRIARDLGCEIATPSEARQMLGIPSLTG